MIMDTSNFFSIIMSLLNDKKENIRVFLLSNSSTVYKVIGFKVWGCTAKNKISYL